MPLAPDPALARAALAELDALRDTVAAAEDDVLACLVVTGEPRPQRVLDDWLDQVADTLRALGEAAADLAPALARHAVPSAAADHSRGPASDAVPPGADDGSPERALGPHTVGPDAAGPDTTGRGTVGHVTEGNRG